MVALHSVVLKSSATLCNTCPKKIDLCHFSSMHSYLFMVLVIIFAVLTFVGLHVGNFEADCGNNMIAGILFLYKTFDKIPINCWFD